jgi:hypothetical protein
MNFPDWINHMRRRPKEIKVKDFVDDHTKRELAKIAGEKPIRGKSFAPTAELLEYLAQSRTIREVAQKFSYSSDNAAYQALRWLLRKGEVARVGHKQYAATSFGVSTFNLNQLSEKDLQEKGLEAFKKNQKPEATPHYNLYTLSSRQRQEAIVKFCSEPRPSTEIAKKFGYATTSGIDNIMKTLMKAKKVTVLPYRAGLAFVYQETKAYKATQKNTDEIKELAGVDEHESPEPAFQLVTEKGGKIHFEKPEPVTYIPEKHTVTDYAMKYSWENDLTGDARAILKDFIKWVDEQENK